MYVQNVKSLVTRRLGVPAVVVVLASLIIALTTGIRAQARDGEKPPTKASAAAAFEQFKRLEGKWRGRSTKGWEEVSTYKTIAAGSVVVGTSFDAHPNETMMTMFHLDGDRLMLTHYCVAKNQPRLVATSIADGGKTITFTFLDGGNLSSRDRGHMDKAVFRFIDDNHATSQWTWYQNGKESWMEEIRLERVP